MKPYILTEVTSDFPQQCYLDDFAVMPMHYMLDDEEFDGVDKKLSAKEFYERMKAGAKSNTSMVDEHTMRKYMEPLLKEGREILYLVFSSGLSGSYSNAVRVTEDLRKEYPGARISLVDSRNASMGEGLFVWYVLQKREEGATLEELTAYAESMVNHVCSYFTVDDLNHLARLGRVTKTAAFIGTLAGIKPVLFVNTPGKLIPIAKVVSRKKSLRALVDKMGEKMLPAAEQKMIFIGHGLCYEDAEFVKNLICERYGIAPERIVIDDIGPVIGAHTSAGVVALFFLGTDKKEANDTSD